MPDEPLYRKTPSTLALMRKRARLTKQPLRPNARPVKSRCAS